MLPRMKLASTFLLLALMFSFLPAGTSVGYAAQTACDSAELVPPDPTVPDGTNFAPGATFKKTWKLKNIGTCTWATTYSLVFDSGAQMGGPASVNLAAAVAPGGTVDLSVDLTAPSTAGTYQGYWKLKNASGVVFGTGAASDKAFWVIIIVPGVATGGYDFAAHAADAGVVWSNSAGAMTYGGSDGTVGPLALKLDNPKFEDGKIYGSTLLFVPNNVTDGFIQAVYPAYTVQSGDHFKAQIGCRDGATTCYVSYRLLYQKPGTAQTPLWRNPNPFLEKYEGQTYPVDVNLSSLVGQNVQFILLVKAYGSPAGDSALWGTPLITGGTPPPPPASCTDLALFKGDVTVPDGTSFAPNATFKKTWELQNIGTCTWTNYSLIYDPVGIPGRNSNKLDKMGGPDSSVIPITVAPKATVQISVNLTAPGTAGSYTSYWKLKNDKGVVFGLCPFGNCSQGSQKPFWVDITVTGTAVTKALKLTTTASPTTYNAKDQKITLTYVITNTGSVPLGPDQFKVTDSLVSASPINCGASTITLDLGAKLTCTGDHIITDADLAVPSIVSNATASGGGAPPILPTPTTITKQ